VPGTLRGLPRAQWAGSLAAVGALLAALATGLAPRDFLRGLLAVYARDLWASRALRGAFARVLWAHHALALAAGAVALARLDGPALQCLSLGVAALEAGSLAFTAFELGLLPRCCYLLLFEASNAAGVGVAAYGSGFDLAPGERALFVGAGLTFAWARHRQALDPAAFGLGRETHRELVSFGLLSGARERFLGDAELGEQHWMRAWSGDILTGSLDEEGLRLYEFWWPVVLFPLLAVRLLFPPLWTLPFVPGLSPVYDQGRVWAEDRARRVAVVLHIAAGIAMYLTALAQFHTGLRQVTSVRGGKLTFMTSRQGIRTQSCA
jgi:hypothetical protein